MTLTSMNHWYLGARPKTLPAAFAPVLVASSLAFSDDALDITLSVLAGLVALSLQIGVNYANDYSDGIKGTDDERVGPIRLVGSGLASAGSVKRAAVVSFLLAALFGLLFTLISQVWLFLPLGLLAILSAWYYTGGNNPYGYKGLGEISVFFWFGLVAVLGTYYAQTSTITMPAVLLALGSGGFACALLVINNLRDRVQDELVGKRTLAVRLGDRNTRFLYVALVWLGFGTSALIGLLYFLDTNVPLLAALGFLASLLAHKPGRSVLKGVTGKDLILCLQQTSQAQLFWAITTSLGIVASQYLLS